MGQKLVKTGVELDAETHLRVTQWAVAERQSKRKHLANVLRRLTSLRTTHPHELAKLGLIDPRTLPTPTPN